MTGDPTAFDRLASLRTVGPNWDGYGADAPRAECIDIAVRLLRENPDIRRLPPPYVSPTRIGGVLLAWFEGPHQLEIEIDSPERGSFVLFDEQTEDSAEGTFRPTAAVARSPLPMKALVEAFPVPVAA